MTARKIGVFTGNRAEYGLLVPVLRALRDAPDLNLALFVGLRGLSDEGENFPVAATVPIARADATPASTPRAIGEGILGLTDALVSTTPDVFVVYGDRYEAFAAMIAATQMGLPTAHIEGGDMTQGGTLDDVVRHAMTKLAHIHLATNPVSAAHIRQLGEEDWRIHDVGFPTLDLIRAGDFSPPDEVLAELGLTADRPLVIFTQHPITTSHGTAGAEIDACLTALDDVRTELDAQIVLTYPNSDLGSESIIQALEQWAAERPDVVLRKSLGRRLYHGVLNLCGRVTRGVCVGNSSSGVKETGAFECPAVNIGPRQSGRLAGDNVAHVDVDPHNIFRAIRRALTDGVYRDAVRAAPNPYGEGDTGARVTRVLRELDLDDPRLLNKQTILPPV
ncbi:MAG: UDP-N-acetylglucosamine 2-epimerase (hydrolyzing) [Silicimonas sp.]|nr:UDP-N-acetylglucosamine 2-epimerase (hydrolyzing) [Silicimonas sp.]